MSQRIWPIAVPLCTVVLWLAAATPLLADASYKETTQITGGSLVGMMKLAGTFSSQARKADQPITSAVYVSGNRMARVRPDGAEIIDLDAGTITQIDAVKHQYTTMTFEQMRQQLEQAQRNAEAKAKETKADAPPQSANQSPQNVDMSFDVHVRETGATKEVSGLNTNEAIMTMAMNATDKNTQQTGALAITNDMWLATSTPVYDEVRAFDEKFAKKMGQVFSGNQTLQGMQSLMAQPGAAKGMGEMAKEVSKLKGRADSAGDANGHDVRRQATTRSLGGAAAGFQWTGDAERGRCRAADGDVGGRQQAWWAWLGSGGRRIRWIRHKKKAADAAPAQPAEDAKGGSRG